MAGTALLGTGDGLLIHLVHQRPITQTPGHSVWMARVGPIGRTSSLAVAGGQGDFGGPASISRTARRCCQRLHDTTYHPAEVANGIGQSAAGPTAFARNEGARPSELLFYRGHWWVHLRYGPVTRSPSRGWLGRLASSGSFPPRRQPQLRGVCLFPRWDCLPLNRPAFAGRTRSRKYKVGDPARSEAMTQGRRREVDRGKDQPGC